MHATVALHVIYVLVC